MAAPVDSDEMMSIDRVAHSGAQGTPSQQTHAVVPKERRLNVWDRWSLAASGAFVFVCFCLWLVHGRRNNSPFLMCESQVRDMGNVAIHSVIQTTFELKNMGSTPVTIVELSKSCGCLEATASDMQVGRNQSVKIDVKYRIDVLGRQKRELLVRTNPPEAAMRLILTCVGMSSQE